jgi:glycogen debranching enzyme
MINRTIIKEQIYQLNKDLGSSQKNGHVSRGKTIADLRKFLNFTEKYTSQSSEPGDYYKAVWCRDAAYILKDQFLSGHHLAVLEQLKYIWKKQIGIDSTKLIHGRGSPKTNFTPTNVQSNMIKTYYGALPTTIFDNFSEIYAYHPDIDSTALMIYVSSWILTNMIRDSANKSKKQSSILTQSIEHLIPFLFRGINFLTTRDEDKDGLLEQDHNEDWMDTVLRNGKVVYSQACWLMALISFSNLLLFHDKKDKALTLQNIASQLVDSIEKKMWSDKVNCYVDIAADKSAGDESPGIIFQDVVFYVFALTELLPDIGAPLLKVKDLKHVNANHYNNKALINNKRAKKIKKRLILTLGSIKDRTWIENIPLVTEKPLLKTGPWILQSNEYHNYTHWPWITAVELLTRFRFGQSSECEILLSNISNRNGRKNKSNHDNIFYEWVNPKTKTGGGAYPFRTGISAYRLASYEIMSR